jgi:hypothetical protein
MLFNISLVALAQPAKHFIIEEVVRAAQRELFAWQLRADDNWELAAADSASSRLMEVYDF